MRTDIFDLLLWGNFLVQRVHQSGFGVTELLKASFKKPVNQTLCCVADTVITEFACENHHDSSTHIRVFVFLNCTRPSRRALHLQRCPRPACDLKPKAAGRKHHSTQTGSSGISRSANATDTREQRHAVNRQVGRLTQAGPKEINVMARRVAY